MRFSIRDPDEATIRLFDGLVLLWAAIWLLIGAWTCLTLWQVADVGDTISVSGTALKSSGEALTGLAPVPVVGDDGAALGADVTAAAGDVIDRGQQLTGQLRQLSVLLGLAIIVVPMAPVAGVYLPMRLARRREVTAIRGSLARHVDDLGLDRYLAERAVAHLPYAEIRAASSDPWGDLASGQVRALADAELARLGVVRPG